MKINTDKILNNDRSAIVERQIKPKDDNFNTSIMDSNVGCDDGFYIEDPSVKCTVTINGHQEDVELDILPDLSFISDLDKDEKIDEDEVIDTICDSVTSEDETLEDAESLELKKEFNIKDNGKLTLSTDVLRLAMGAYNGKVKYEHDLYSDNKMALNPYTSIEYEQRLDLSSLNFDNLDSDSDDMEIPKAQFLNFENGLQGRITPTNDLNINYSSGIKLSQSLDTPFNPQFDSINGKIDVQYNPTYDLQVNVNGGLSFKDADNNTKSLGLKIKKDGFFGNSANLNAQYSTKVDSNPELELQTVSRNLSISGDLKRNLENNTTISLSGKYNLEQSQSTMFGVKGSNDIKQSLDLKGSVDKKFSEDSPLTLSAGYNLNFTQNDTMDVTNSITAKAEIKQGKTIITDEFNLSLDKPNEFKNTIGVKINFD